MKCPEAWCIPQSEESRLSQLSEFFFIDSVYLLPGPHVRMLKDQHYHGSLHKLFFFTCPPIGSIIFAHCLEL